MYSKYSNMELQTSEERARYENVIENIYVTKKKKKGGE